MAPPKKKISEREVELLASAFCTNEEIAAKLDCSSDTLTRRYAEYLKKGRDNAKASLRVIQWKHAQKNAVMAIWLGKQYLGQKDKQEIDVEHSGSVKQIQTIEVMKTQESDGSEPDGAESGWEPVEI